MEKRIFVVANDLCSGCRNCEMWCSFIHGHRGEFNPMYSKIRIFREREGSLNIPTVNCDGAECRHDGIQEPICIEMCPTGTLVYTNATDLDAKRQELNEKKRLQPVFRLIVPWKYPYPWRPWSEEDF